MRAKQTTRTNNDHLFGRRRIQRQGTLSAKTLQATQRLINRDLDDPAAPWRVTLHSDLAKAGLI